MNVVENVAAGAIFGRAAILPREAVEKARAERAFVGPGAMAEAPTSSLTLPGRKRLELARSLAMRPRILLLER